MGSPLHIVAPFPTRLAMGLLAAALHGAVGFLGVLALPGSVSAQPSVIVVVQAGDAPLDALERARAGAVEVLAENGVRLIPTPDGAACEETDCAAELAGTSAAQLVLLIEIAEAEVTVRGVPPTGTPHEASQPLAESSVAVAVGAAVEQVLEASAAPSLGFLMIRSEPIGARVTLDGRREGTTPFRRSIAPGPHHVELHLDGQGTVTRAVTVQAGREAGLDIDFAEEDEDGGSAESAAEPETRTEPSPWNWAIGGALAIGGIVALTSPLTTLAREGECVELVQDVGCLEMVRFGPQSGILLGVGVALLIAAVVVDVTAPVRVDVEVSETSLRTVVEGHF